MGLDSGYGIGSLKPGVCTSTTRPASPFTGQTIYDTTTSTTLVWNGTAWVTQTTSVLQVKTVNKANAFTTTSGSYVDVTDLTISITPTSSSNKILVLLAVQAGNTGGDGAVQLVRDSTAIAVGTAGSIMNGYGIITADYAISTMGLCYIDSPATTSATTYKVQAKCNGGTTTVNRRGTDSVFGAYSTITVMEVTP